MNHGSKALFIGIIVVAVLFAAGLYVRNFRIDAENDGSIAAGTDGSLSRISSGTATSSQHVHGPDGHTHVSERSDRADLEVSEDADIVSADLEESKRRLEQWSDELFTRFPSEDAKPALSAMVNGYDQLLVRVATRNEQLQEQGVSTRERKKLLYAFGVETARAINHETGAAEIVLRLYQSNPQVQIKITNYLHDNIVPLPDWLVLRSESP